MNYDRIEYQTYLLKHEAKQNKGARGSRDTERKKTYESEWEFQKRVEIPQFKTIEEAQRFGKKIYKSKTWQKLWEQSTKYDVSRFFAASPKIVSKQRNTGRGTAGFTNGYTVTLDTIAGFDAYTLIHELTHCLGHMHHGRSFRKTLLSMVGVFLGAEHKKILKEEFKKRKLACGEPRNPLTFEQWKAARDRMEKMRNAR
jgi:hypothetical protein